MLSDMQEKHNNALMDLRNSLEEKLPLKFKYSSELLNLLKMQNGLAKQKKYAEAHQIQQRCNKKEQQESNKYMKDREQKIQTAENTLRKQQ